jgi:hypothetical protein
MKQHCSERFNGMATREFMEKQHFVFEDEAILMERSIVIGCLDFD